MSDSSSPVPVENASLRAYYHVLRDDVVARLSGSIGVLLAFAAAYLEWVAKNGKASLWIASAVAFLIATYRLWANERQRYSKLVEHKVIPHVIKESNAHVAEWFGMPAVSVILGLKFENLDSNEIALKAVRLRLCERRGKEIWELPLRGSDSKELHRKVVGSGLPSSTVWTFKDQPIPIEGLRIKPKDYSSEPYYFINDTMAFPDYAGDIENGKHFLQLTVEAVGQKPYILDIEVDWTQPGLFILSSKPSDKPANTLRSLRDAEQTPPELETFKQELRRSLKEGIDEKRERKKLKE